MTDLWAVQNELLIDPNDLWLLQSRLLFAQSQLLIVPNGLLMVTNGFYGYRVTYGHCRGKNEPLRMFYGVIADGFYIWNC